MGAPQRRNDNITSSTWKFCTGVISGVLLSALWAVFVQLGSRYPPLAVLYPSPRVVLTVIWVVFFGGAWVAAMWSGAMGLKGNVITTAGLVLGSGILFAGLASFGLV